jgi:hypothetical protein
MLGCRVPPYQHYRPFTSAAVAILALSLSLSCQSKTDKVGAKGLSDAFMADLVANHLDDALSKMDPAFVQMAGGRECHRVNAEDFRLLWASFEQCL